MHGVRAFAHAAHAVKRWNSHTSSKVPIGATANGSFLQLPTHLLRDAARLFVECCHPGSPLHREAIHAACHFECAMLVEGFERAQLAIDSGGLPRSLDANIHPHRGLGGNYIRTRSTFNHARVYRQALAQIIHLGNYADLARQFENGAVPFPGVESRMRGDAVHAQPVLAHALARSLDGTSKSGGGL